MRLRTGEEQVENEREGSVGMSQAEKHVVSSSCGLFSPYVATTLLVCGFAFLVRVLLSLHSYSGANTPLRFGDYEAQRHWMEITIHTPVRDWYRNTPDNNLTWWGLDYPPLTAYQSYVHGRFLHAFEPDAVALHSSRGFETPTSKVLMRWTVLSSDLLVFLPAALWFLNVYYPRYTEKQRVWLLAAVLLQPALVVIDHGHFQYNCISLGLSVGAAAAIVAGKELLGSVLFVFALNHKQMGMYYAPAFFAHLFGRALRRQNPQLRVFCLGITVILTFAACWSPFLHSKEAALQVLDRIAPLQRGIYEDYVANFWCGTAILFKWKHLFNQPTLAKLALGATVSAALPSMVQQIRAPSKRGFLYGMVNSAFAFFLFSYQVHEKSILLPLVPASLLGLEEPQVLLWFTPYSMFSMLPLLLRDGQFIPYLALVALFFLVALNPSRGFKPTTVAVSSRQEGVLSWLPYVSFFGALVLHFLYFALEPPQRYPFLYEAFIMSYSFAHFVAIAVYMNLKQWSIPEDPPSKEKLS